MIIESIAPARIDLAGGTLDIWPLYLFHPNALTVNLAIDSFARVIIEKRRDKKFIIKSLDRKQELRINSSEQLGKIRQLRLLTKIISFHNPPWGLNITTYSNLPQGSGLGASSALNIALNGALNYLKGGKYSRNKIIEIARDLEAAVLGVPTGEQDHYAAMYGGLNSLWFTAGGVRREKIKTNTKILEKSLILCYSGKERSSGVNNWEIFKRHIEREKNIFVSLEKIKQLTLELRESLLKNDFKKMVRSLKEEWNNRKKLFPGISNPQIEQLIKAGLRKGAAAAKVCGAGGGGYLFFLAPEKNREKIKQELIKNKGVPWDFKISYRGLRIKEL